MNPAESSSEDIDPFLASLAAFDAVILPPHLTLAEPSINEGYAYIGIWQVGRAAGPPRQRLARVSVEFNRTEFSNAAFFSDVAFRGEAAFMHARFAGGATFSGAVFSISACFIDAEFTSRAHFDDTKFMGITLFQKSRFLDGSSLGGIILSCEVSCRGAKFTHAPPGELCVATADEEEAPPPGLEGQ